MIRIMSKDRKTLNERLFQVICELESPENDAISKYHNNHKYPTLGAVLKVLKPALKKHEILVQQFTQVNNLNEHVLTTVLCDLSDDTNSIEFSLPLINPTDMQKMGSAITYARRYSLMTIFQMTAEDDDGSAAVRKTKAAPKPAIPPNANEYVERNGQVFPKENTKMTIGGNVYTFSVGVSKKSNKPYTLIRNEQTKAVQFEYQPGFQTLLDLWRKEHKLQKQKISSDDLNDE